MREIAYGPAKVLSGSGRGDVHERAIRLCELLDQVPQGDIRLIVEHELDPDKWATNESSSPDLARLDMERLRRESLRMLDEAEEELSLTDLVLALRSRIATREPMGQEENPGIEIVTLWGAKGLTADFAYIVGLCDEALPGPPDEDATGLTAGEHDLEQQRLLYVSLTRAKRALVISRPTRIRRGEVPPLASRGIEAQIRGGRICTSVDSPKNLPPDALPDSVPGQEWQGLNLGYSGFEFRAKPVLASAQELVARELGSCPDRLLGLS